MSQFATDLNQGLSFIVRNNAPQGKSLKIFNVAIGNNQTLDLMKIPGISEDDIKASLVKGELGKKLNSNYLKVVSSTLNFDSSDSTYTSLLTSYGLSASTGGSGEGLVANVAALTSIITSNEVDGAEREVSTLLQLFKLDKSSAATVDNITVAATDSGVGRWLRIQSSVPKWTNQQTWGVDTGVGNDENSGADSVGNRLKTVSEIARRLAHFNFTDYTVNVIGTVAATDKPKFTGHILSGGSLTTATEVRMTFNGVRTPVAGFPGGTIGTATATDVVTTPSTGLSQTMFTDAAVADWRPYADPTSTSKSKLAVITSGPNAGLQAWTIFANPDSASSVLNGGVNVNRVRTTNWMNDTLATINGTASKTAASAAVVASLSGQTYALYDVSPWLSPMNMATSFPNRIKPYFKDFEFSTLFSAQGDGIVQVSSTKHVGAGGGTGSFITFYGGVIQAKGSLVHFSTLAGVAGSPVLALDGPESCGFINVQMAISWGALGAFSNCTLQSSFITTSFTGATAIRPGLRGTVTANGTFGLGIYDPPTAVNAITVRRDGIFGTEGPLHGFGAVAGSLRFLACDDGGVVLIKTGQTPTGTNTAGQVQLEGSATAMPPLEASAGGSLPALSALTTWAEWAAAPFSRNVMNFGTGSKIIDITGTG